MDWDIYTENHVHPSGFYGLEFIAYERRDGRWDLFAREAQGVCPELEEGRVDEQHIFLTSLKAPSQIDIAAEAVMAELGDSYDAIVFYKETGGRRVIDRLCEHFMRHRTGFYCIEARDLWEFVIRRKDSPLAEEVTPSNV